VNAAVKNKKSAKTDKSARQKSSTPEIIALTGGKGGTGKSTAAIILAFSLIQEGQKVLLVDCDVECPNDHILLGIDGLDNPAEKTFSFYPHFNESKCRKCGLCVEKCRAGALFQPSDSIPVLQEDLCTSCGVCWSICPHHAISKKKQQNGEIFLSKITDDLTLLTGRSITGVRETSPIVKQTKDFIHNIAKEVDTVIIDTAAGTHCTVMTAIDGADRALAVTEPTPLGAHDLDIILDVLDVLKVPSGIVLNKYGIGNEDLIKKIAITHEKKIEYHIPFDSKFAEIYSEGQFLENKSYLINLLVNN
jgi:MinD superfamily P-loop ATPase